MARRSPLRAWSTRRPRLRYNRRMQKASSGFNTQERTSGLFFEGRSSSGQHKQVMVGFVGGQTISFNSVSEIHVLSEFLTQSQKQIKKIIRGTRK